MTLRIELLGDCDAPYCVGLAEREYETLNKPTYSYGVSIRAIEFLDILDPYRERRTARKRALRAVRRGYRVETFEPRYWHRDMLAINRSLPERQGRPMDRAYVDLPETTSLIGRPTCMRHHNLVYGVFTRKHSLVAYATIYRVGELVHVSQFLGHGDHLDDGIMFFLLGTIMSDQAFNGDGVLFYNRHDSGTEGLRWFKERCGLTKGKVAWTLGM